MRKVFLGFTVGVLLMLSVPVVADHVSEPTAPITGTALELYEYGNKAVTLLTACDGTETVTFDFLRVESVITDTGRPSEHFDEWIILYQTELNGRSPRYIWQVRWRHSNVPPHGTTRNGDPHRWESSETNQKLNDFEPGIRLRFTSRIEGLESGGVFLDSCDFIVG